MTNVERSSCTPCAAGTYVDETGQASCKACPAGYFAGVAAGDGFSVAVTAAGAVLTFGSNTSGRLGDGTTTARHEPRAVDLE